MLSDGSTRRAFSGSLLSWLQKHLWHHTRSADGTTPEVLMVAGETRELINNVHLLVLLTPLQNNDNAVPTR